MIEGLDGSGKATQAKRLAGRWPPKGERCARSRSRIMPVTRRPWSRCIWAGGSAPPGRCERLRSFGFYSVDRFASYKTDWGAFYRGEALWWPTAKPPVMRAPVLKLPPDQWEAFGLAV